MAIKKTDKPSSLLQETYERFWNGFNLYTKGDDTFSSEFRVHPYPSIRSYQNYHIGEPYHLVASINFFRKGVRVMAYFSSTKAYQMVYDLARVEIEDKLNRTLIWNLYRTKAAVALYDTADFDEERGWQNAYQVLAVDMINMKKAFNWVPNKPINEYGGYGKGQNLVK